MRQVFNNISTDYLSINKMWSFFHKWKWRFSSNLLFRRTFNFLQYIYMWRIIIDCRIIQAKKVIFAICVTQLIGTTGFVMRRSPRPDGPRGFANIGTFAHCCLTGCTWSSRYCSSIDSQLSISICILVSMVQKWVETIRIIKTTLRSGLRSRNRSIVSKNGPLQLE